MFIKLFGKRHTSLTDEELVAEYKDSGDEKAASVLFERYTLLVFGVCMKYLKDEDESKDAVLEIFEKLLSSLKKHEVENFRAWLHTVSKNFCLMALRKRKLEVSVQHLENLSEQDMENANSAHLIHETQEEQQEKLLGLNAALSSLNAEQRICVELFFLEEKSYQQIVETTGFSMNQVKSYIQNGKRNLRIKLEKLGIWLFVCYLFV